MKKLALLPALALAALPFVGSPAPVGAAAGDLSTVSITVSMDLPVGAGSSGPIVYQVTDVPVGAGPELTGADLVSNPSKWGGSLNVDVDNTTHTITVTPDSAGNFQTADITITSPGLGAITLVSDNLWLNGAVPSSAQARNATTGAPVAAEMALTFGSTGGTASIDWATTVADQSLNMREGGAAIFTFAPRTPDTTVTPTSVTPTTVAAKAVVVRPAFTG